MIRSRQNKKIKDMRALRRSKDGLALLEGPILLGEAIASGVELAELLVTPEFAAGAEGRSLLAAAGREAVAVDPDLLRDLADADAPQGVVAAARLPRRGIDSLPLRRGGVYLFLDGVQDPGNLGAVARVAEATAATGLACGPGCAHPNHPRALRASAGSLLRLPVAWNVTPGELAARLAPAGARWAALVAHDGEDLYAAAATLRDTLVLALGAEGAGLSAEAAALAERRLRIPLAPPVESLNVATAAAVALFELRRRVLAAESPVAQRAARAG